MQGDVERCRELLDLTRSILKQRHLDSIQDMNHARIVANFLFSLMNCPDEHVGRQVLQNFCHHYLLMRQWVLMSQYNLIEG